MTSQAHIILLVGFAVLTAAFQTQSGWLYLIGALALAIVISAGILARFNMRGLTIRVLPTTPVDRGTPLTITVCLERGPSGSGRGLQLLLPGDCLVPYVDPTHDSPERFAVRPLGKWWFPYWRTSLLPAGWQCQSVAEVSANNRADFRFQVPTPRRGEFTVDGWAVQSAFPLGLIALIGRLARSADTSRKGAGAPEGDRCLVYPVGTRLTDVAWLHASPLTQGMSPRLEHGQGQVLRGVREYRAGDPWRQIHWRTTARRGQPYCKETEQETSETLAIWLDMRRDVHTDESLEHAVTVATSLVAFLREAGREVTLSTQPEASPPEAGHASSRHLAWLARVQAIAPPGPAKGPEGAIVISPAYLVGWQGWANHFVFCPPTGSNPMDATAFCAVGMDISDCLGVARNP